MQQLGIGRKGDGLRLNRGVDRDALEVLTAQRAGFVGHPQALGQQELQLVAEPLAPMAQVASLVREVMLEKLTKSASRTGDPRNISILKTCPVAGWDLIGSNKQSPNRMPRGLPAKSRKS